MSDSTITKFISLLNESLDKNNFVRLVLVNRRDKSSTLKSASAKVISIKKGLRLSFVLRHETKDITENYTFAECGAKVESLLLNDFSQADLLSMQMLNISYDFLPTDCFFLICQKIRH